MAPEQFRANVETSKTDSASWLQDTAPSAQLNPCVTVGGQQAAVLRGVPIVDGQKPPSIHDCGYLLITAQNTDPNDDTVRIDVVREYHKRTLKRPNTQPLEDRSMCVAAYGMLMLRSNPDQNGACITITLPDAACGPLDPDNFSAYDYYVSIRVNDQRVVSPAGLL